MKEKYAIYKGKVGLYAKLYIDTLEGCKDLLGGYLVKQEDLPIVVNNAGGRCSFYPVEHNFVEIVEVEEGKEPLTREQMYPKNSDEFLFGWIDLEGNTYACGFEDHYISAQYICEELGYKSYNAERTLEEKGWIKISREIPYTYETRNKQFVYVEDCFITKKQADTLFDLGLYDDRYVKMFIRHSQDKW